MDVVDHRPAIALAGEIGAGRAAVVLGVDEVERVLAMNSPEAPDPGMRRQPVRGSALEIDAFDSSKRLPEIHIGMGHHQPALLQAPEDLLREHGGAVVLARQWVGRDHQDAHRQGPPYPDGWVVRRVNETPKIERRRWLAKPQFFDTVITKAGDRPDIACSVIVEPRHTPRRRQRLSELSEAVCVSPLSRTFIYVQEARRRYRRALTLGNAPRWAAQFGGGKDLTTPSQFSGH